MADEKKNPLVTVLRYSELGFVLPAGVVLGYLLGRVLDYWLKTHWIFIAGAIFGAVAGFVSMIRMALDSEHEQ